MNESEYTQRMITHRKQIKGYLISLIGLLIGVLIGTTAKFGWFVAGICVLYLMGVLFWRISTNSKAFNRERALRYYLRAFKCYHTATPFHSSFRNWNIWPYFASVYWIAYRRMPVYALFFVIPFALIQTFATLSLIDASDKDADLIFRLISLVFSGIIGSIANRLYFKSTCSRIRKVLSLPKEQAMAQLQSNGGTNGWSWGGFLILLFVLLLPADAYVSDVKERRALAIETQRRADEEAREKAAAEAAAAAVYAEQERRLQVVISEIEARYPQLDENSPHFDSQLANIALDRMKHYVSQGVEPATALRNAVSDLEREAAAARSGYR